MKPPDGRSPDAIWASDGRVGTATATADQVIEREWAEEQVAHLLAREQTVRAAADAAQQRLSFLAAASRVFASSHDYETTLEQVARLAVPTFADWCVVDLLAEDQSVRQVAVAHQDPDQVELARALRRRYPPAPDAPHSVWQVLRTQQSDLVPDVTDSLLAATAFDAEHLEIERALGLRSFMQVPLSARGEVLGAIWFATAESGRRYSPEDLALAEELARCAAMAIDTARLHREAQDYCRRAAVAIDNARLYRESHAAMQGKKDQSLAVVDALLAGAPVGIAFLDRNLRYVRVNPRLAAIHGVPVEEHLGHTVPEVLADLGPLLEPPLRDTLESGVPVVDLEVSGKTSAGPDPQRHWLVSYFPVCARDEQTLGIGEVVVDITEHKRAEEEQQRLRVLLERERHLVQTLAQSFLGRTRQFPGLQVASFYEPAAKAERVGGDYFDFIEIDSRRLGVVIGDVCGKGLPAALYTAMAKYMLRAYVREEPEPQQVLYRLNQALHQEILDDGMYLTLVYGVLDLEAGTFTYANAGHPAPVLYTPASRSCQHLEATGGIIGAIPDWRYQQRTVCLEQGAVLALFTDGVTEAAGWGDHIDHPEVAALLEAHAGESADAIGQALFDWTQEMAGRSLRDDVAIVVLRRV